MVATVRRYHRWLMLFVGLQFLVWSASGLYMVLINIHSIHGETWVSKPQRLLQAFAEADDSANHAGLGNSAQSGTLLDFVSLISSYPDASNIKLGWLAETPVYRFTTNSGSKLLDATTGELVDGISQDAAVAIALSELAEPFEIESVFLLTENPPSEIGSRALPLWQVNFYGLDSPSLYISQQSGEIVAVRHNFWRIFDVLWRLHIMDYYDGEDINNLLLNVFTISGFLAVLCGSILLGFRLFKNGSAEQAT